MELGVFTVVQKRGAPATEQPQCRVADGEVWADFLGGSAYLCSVETLANRSHAAFEMLAAEDVVFRIEFDNRWRDARRAWIAASVCAK